METQRLGRSLSTSRSRSFTTIYAVRIRSGLELTPHNQSQPAIQGGGLLSPRPPASPGSKGRAPAGSAGAGAAGLGVRPRGPGQARDEDRAHAPTHTDFWGLAPEPPALSSREDVGKGSGARPSAKSPRCHLWQCPG